MSSPTSDTLYFQILSFISLESLLIFFTESIIVDDVQSRICSDRSMISFSKKNNECLTFFEIET